MNSLPQIDVNEICAILRLYSEMEIEQASFYESLGDYLEGNLSKIDETGLVNAILTFKFSGTTQKQLPVVIDLEQILEGNIMALSLDSISQLLFAYTKLRESYHHSQSHDDRKNTRLTETLLRRGIEMVSSQPHLLSTTEVYFMANSVIRLQTMLTETEYLDILRVIFKDFDQIVEHYRDQELQLMFALLSELQNRADGFDVAFGATRDEVQRRRSEGMEMI